jgi:hypothetical protein
MLIAPALPVDAERGKDDAVGAVFTNHGATTMRVVDSGVTISLSKFSVFLPR